MRGAALLRFEKAPREHRGESASPRSFSTELFWVRPLPPREGCPPARVPVLRKAVQEEILSDALFAAGCDGSAWPPPARPGHRWWCLEKTMRPGVTDNAGQVLSEAVRLVTGYEAECRSGRRTWLELPDGDGERAARAYADEVFHNALIERAEVRHERQARADDEGLFRDPSWPGIVQGDGASGAVESIPIHMPSLDDLVELSEARLWALTRDELKRIQAHYRELGRPATDVEMEVLAQTWSEHCKHKIFAADIEVVNEREDLELPERVEGLFKTYIRGATEKIPASYLRSVFVDNAGVIQVTRELDCAIKVETHNSPSALDPYGGALTGIVGVNRDILGVGLGAHPIANLDVFCVGPLDVKPPLPPRLHHPRRVLDGVRLGVEHGGNKSGIPTVTGAVVHHPGYLGKPLVYCGTVGILPARARDLIHKKILPGDRIVMVGGRIGKDGIHGATFSSLEMKEDSPVSAVQLGDPLTQRRVWDFLLEARDKALFRAVTDNGAGGLSSSVGELARLCGKKGGARLDVAKAPVKYEGLAPWELVVSESQERMTLAVAPDRLSELRELAARRGVECSDLGEFEDSGRFLIQYDGRVVGELDMQFLHEGVPTMKLIARVARPKAADRRRFGAWRALGKDRLSRLRLEEALPAVLALPNVRSRRGITERYDHEVQARSVRKPYGTPGHAAPGDGAALRLSRETHEGVALGLGLAPFAAEIDPGVAAELALDEAVRNAVAAGMDPAHAALVDNFCWPDPLPGPNNPQAREAHLKLGALVLSCKRIHDAAVMLGMPFVSGKDSMKNDYRVGETRISVPPTLLITAMGKVHDMRRVPRGHAVDPRRETGRCAELGPRRVLWVSGQDVHPDANGLPRVDFARAQAFYLAFHAAVREGLVESVHDVSDGGWLAATAELLFGTGAGAWLDIEMDQSAARGEPEWAPLFGEPATSFVCLARESDAQALARMLSGFLVLDVGRMVPSDRDGPSNDACLSVAVHGSGGGQLDGSWPVERLARAYAGEAE